MTEEFYKRDIEFFKRKVNRFFQQKVLVQVDLNKMTKKYEELQQKCEELQQEVNLLTIPVKDRFEILDL